MHNQGLKCGCFSSCCVGNLLVALVLHQVTGEEEPMYHAKVVVTRKVRKNDLPVKSGDTVGIIRTTSCPKGKWLARDGNNKCEFSLWLDLDRCHCICSLDSVPFC